MLRNVNDRGGGKFETCGLTSSKDTQWQPKLSWYYVATLTNVLGHMRHTESTVDNTTKLHVARFDADPSVTSAGLGTRAVVVWLGTVS